MIKLGKFLFWVLLLATLGLVAFRGKQCLDTIGNENRLYDQEVNRIERIRHRALEGVE